MGNGELNGRPNHLKGSYEEGLELFSFSGTIY